jgi:hypothetical protein
MLLPGPAVLREPLAVTAAAQLGVAPVLLSTFGPLPVASLPANLLAVPVAGLVMTWGLTGGLVAGWVGGTVAEVVQAPTRLLLWWLEEVAQRASRLPAGQLGGWQVGVLALGLGLAVWAADRRSDAGGERHSTAGPVAQPKGLRRGDGLRDCGLTLAAAALASAIIASAAPPPLRSDLAPGLVRWHAGSTEVVVVGAAAGRFAPDPASVLSELRQAGIGGISLLVVADPAVGEELVSAIQNRHPVGAALLVRGSPAGEAVIGRAVEASTGASELAVGSLAVRIVATADRLVVEAVPAERIHGSR